MDAQTLSISLPDDIVEMVRREVESGAFASNSDVVREALLLWRHRHDDRESRLQAIRAKINEAAQQTEHVTADEMRRHFERLASEMEKKRAL